MGGLFPGVPRACREVPCGIFRPHKATEDLTCHAFRLGFVCISQNLSSDLSFPQWTMDKTSRLRKKIRGGRCLFESPFVSFGKRQNFLIQLELLLLGGALKRFSGNRIACRSLHFSPALRRESIRSSPSAGFLKGMVFAKDSKDNLGCILRTSAAALRASSSRPNKL